MSAFHGIVRNGRKTKLAFFIGRFAGNALASELSLQFIVHSVDGSDDKEHRDADNEKAQQAIDEASVIDRDGSCLLGVCQRCKDPAVPAEQQELIREIRVAQKKTDRRQQYN